ncbi:MAG TPA: hypothetical protein IGS17_11365 [Oscillatoriales cyanobacterium M59_W2019_021]|nr:MAG: hypothetical protein D6728_12035 [Cyanobacteria bacterium J055]HIK33109.1 hypothetical protein [Oscillatoriales cyanobacterium M4454_W2019_049]HIK51503.1 hypothetical protein [Oscillatoriales cyanobacterium M59_W2019_021]
MVRSPLTEDLADLLQNAPELNFEIPNPEDEELPEFEFNQRVETAWVVCDRFDLQTDIWRGRILRAVRDREKKGGEGRGKGFLNWLKDREISKSQAYALIELANSADTLLAEGKLQPEAINNFSKRAFVETAQSPLQVQQLVSEAASGGDRITRREVKQLTDEWVAMTSDLLPEEVKEKAADRSLPPKHVAPLVRELEKLPESHQQEIQRTVAESPDIDTVKQLTSDARNLSKYLDAAAQVQTIDPNIIDLELALEEALRIGCLNVAADLVKQSAQLEQTAVKLYTTWKRLAGIADRLYVDTGASTPNLRSLITCIERITGSIVEVPLDDSKERTVRLQILTE